MAMKSAFAPAAFALLLSVSVSAGQPAQAQTVELRVADTFPPTYYLTDYIIRPFMEKVQDQLQDDVKFTYLGAGQLGGLNEMLGLVQGGVVDIAYTGPSAATDILPLAGVAELPGLFDTSCQGTVAFYEAATRGKLHELDFGPNGIRLLINVVLPPYQLVLNKEFSSLEETKGQKVRVAGLPQTQLAESIGIVPVSVSAAELYEALARGTIDGAMYPLGSVLDRGLERHLKTSTDGLNFGSGTVMYVMAEDRFQSLPTDVQVALVEAGKAVSQDACQKLDHDALINVQKIRDTGVSLTDLGSGQDREQMEQALAHVQDMWVNLLSDRGLVAAKDVLKEFKSLVP